MGDAIVERPKTAVYSTCHSKRDKRAIELLHAFCAVNGLRCVFYLDKRMPKGNQPSSWRWLMEDVMDGKFDLVISCLEAPGMEELCARHGAKFEQLDVFDWFRGMRARKMNILPKRHLRL